METHWAVTPPLLQLKADVLLNVDNLIDHPARLFVVVEAGHQVIHIETSLDISNGIVNWPRNQSAFVVARIVR